MAETLTDGDPTAVCGETSSEPVPRRGSELVSTWNTSCPAVPGFVAPTLLISTRACGPNEIGETMLSTVPPPSTMTPPMGAKYPPDFPVVRSLTVPEPMKVVPGGARIVMSPWPATTAPVAEA